MQVVGGHGRTDRAVLPLGSGGSSIAASGGSAHAGLRIVEGPADSLEIAPEVRAALNASDPTAGFRFLLGLPNGWL